MEKLNIVWIKKMENKKKFNFSNDENKGFF